MTTEEAITRLYRWMLSGWLALALIAAGIAITLVSGYWLWVMFIAHCVKVATEQGWLP